MKPKYRPTLWWIALAPVLLIAGVGGGTTIFLKQAFRTGLSDTFSAPANRKIEIKEPGTYVLSHDYKTAFKGRLYDTEPALPKETVIILSGPDGDLKIDSSVTSYSTSKEREALEVGRFRISQPGDYTLSVSGLESPRVLTFSQSVMTRIIVSTIASIALNLLGWFGAPAIVILVISARLKEKRRLKALHPELFDDEEPLRG